MQIIVLLSLGTVSLAALSSGLYHRGVTCSYSTAASKGDTCSSFATDWGIDLSTFQSLNPGVQCPDLVPGQDYCVIGTASAPTSNSTSTTPPSTTTTSSVTTTTSSSPYSPTQSGLAPNCDQFYKVALGDQCNTIEDRFHISAQQLYAWNPSINGACSNLWHDYYICVHVPGATTTTKQPPTPTQQPDGVTTPQPTQPNMVSYCGTFQFVNPGDTCQAVASKAYISLEQLLRWNPSAGSDCSGLWANSYACVGIIPAFTLATFYHVDCTGDIHNAEPESMEDRTGTCINTDCAAGSVHAPQLGACPDGQVQVSYWEKPDCTGQWYGYDYTSRNTCLRLWSDGYKFRSLHLRCADKALDCVSQKQCTMDPEPDHNFC